MSASTRRQARRTRIESNPYTTG